MKANPNPSILRIFREEGIEIDASSEQEALDAIRAGFRPEDVSITTQQYPDSMAQLYAQGVRFNAGSLNQLREYSDALPGTSVGLRFNPGIGSGHSAKTNVGGPSSPFGIWHEYVDDAVKAAAENELTVDRIHTHIGSGSDPAVWARAADLTLALVSKFPDVSTVDLGGGFKVARMRDEVGTDLSIAGQAVKNSFERFAGQTGRRLNLEIEPGTFLVANAGAIISTVIDIKDTGEEGHEFLVVDTGMTENLRFSLYGAQHPLVIVSDKPSTQHKKYVVTGHNCESGDLLTPQPGLPEAIDERLLQLASIRDRLVIEGCGAYCSSMAARGLQHKKGYNSFPFAKEILKTVDGGFEDITQE